ncbi:hypothetical protein scyTo_0014003, partial [Scyliorhinus torazame]|nr:hypothetical protein [Scyliorhinus torazame]
EEERERERRPRLHENLMTALCILVSVQLNIT